MSENSIVVLHYKTIDKTIECVGSVLETTCDANVYIVDNHSNDGTVQQLENIYANNNRVQIIMVNDNIGFARANNLAMRQLFAQGKKYAVITNNDIVFQAGAINQLIDSLRKTNEVIVAAPRVISPNHVIQNSVQPKRENAFKYLVHAIIPRRTNTFAESCSDTTCVEVFSGCCFACDLSKMHEIGYFDEYTFLYYEESILSAKAKEKGFDIIYVPDSVVVHYHAASTKGINEMVLGYMLDSELYYMQTYLRITPWIVSFYGAVKRRVHYKKYGSKLLFEMESKAINRIRERQK